MERNIILRAHRTFRPAASSQELINIPNPAMLVMPEAKPKKKPVLGKYSIEFNLCCPESEYPERQ